MKFIVTIGSTKFLLTVEQLDQLAQALGSAETVEDKYVGAGKGRPGSASDAYVTVLRDPSLTPLSSILTVGVMPDDEYNAIKFFTATHKGV